MKKILGILMILISGVSCTDLDVLPTNSDLPPNLFTDADAYRSYLAKIYAAYSHTGQDGPAGQPDITIVNDEGFTSYIRAYWKAQELTTDEAVIAWTDAGIQELNTQLWNSDNQFVRVLYYRIYLIIAYSNDFLELSTPANLELYGVPQSDYPEIEQYRVEARFLRAMAYWHALDLFRNVPLLTSATTELPTQATPEELFNFITSELSDIEADMVDPRQNEYGRADRAAVWMLQAKVYLNGDVYTGSTYYDEVLTAVNNVIGEGYALNEDYRTLFMADNHTSNEIIFSLPSDGRNAQNYGSTTFLVHGSIGGSMVDSDYGVTAGWAGLRTTPSLVTKFPDLQGTIDERAIFYTSDQTLEVTALLEFTNGYAVPKYTNLTSGGQAGSDPTFVDTDYPLFRLADAYLMYAEAVLRGGSGGDLATAVGYINALRERAYNNTNGNIVQGDLTLDFILDERSRELYWEATRRVDLIRYDQYTTSGTWAWKGDVLEGTTTEAFRNVFPIPASDLVANPRLVQNTGY